MQPVLSGIQDGASVAFPYPALQNPETPKGTGQPIAARPLPDRPGKQRGVSSTSDRSQKTFFLRSFFYSYFIIFASSSKKPTQKEIHENINPPDIAYGNSRTGRSRMYGKSGSASQRELHPDGRRRLRRLRLLRTAKAVSYTHLEVGAGGGVGGIAAPSGRDVRLRIGDEHGDVVPHAAPCLSLIHIFYNQC